MKDSSTSRKKGSRKVWTRVLDARSGIDEIVQEKDGKYYLVDTQGLYEKVRVEPPQVNHLPLFQEVEDTARPQPIPDIYLKREMAERFLAAGKKLPKNILEMFPDLA